MSDPKHILVIIDPTAKSQPALERAVWLAQRFEAALELFICDYDQYLAGERFFDSKALEKARTSLISNDVKKLERLADGPRKQGLTVSVDARWDHPLHEGIVKKAAESGADIVVKDTHYHHALKRSVFSNTDWNLIRTCPKPLLLVKPKPTSDEPKVVAAVDPLHEHDKPAELDNTIVDHARRLADATGGQLHMFHAFDVAPLLAVPSDSMSIPSSGYVSEVVEAAERQHRDAVEKLAAKHAIDGAHVHLLQGETRELLVELTERIDANFVVMGAISRSGLQRFRLSSTAERTLDWLPCDVLIINPAATAK
jgi:universal stress protein E